MSTGTGHLLFVNSTASLRHLSSMDSWQEENRKGERPKKSRSKALDCFMFILELRRFFYSGISHLSGANIIIFED